MNFWRNWIGKRKKKAFFDTGTYPEYNLDAPSYQNAVDLIAGWNSKFPEEYGIRAGWSNMFRDPRIRWAIEQFGDLNGRQVLELGPLEAAHTSMLVNAGAKVDAIESSRLAYMKCLITKEILDMRGARFHLGDFVKGLEQSRKNYDLIVASGVLYHMQEPLRLLEAIARRTRSVYLWTVMVKDDSLSFNEKEDFHGVKVRLYARGYGEREASYCGGPKNYPRWIHRDDLLAALKALGFSQQKIAHEVDEDARLKLPSFSIFAAMPN
jgi:hypothetical protein